MCTSFNSNPSTTIELSFFVRHIPKNIVLIIGANMNAHIDKDGNKLCNCNTIEKWAKDCILPFPKKSDFGIIKN